MFKLVVDLSWTLLAFITLILGIEMRLRIVVIVETEYNLIISKRAPHSLVHEIFPELKIAT